TPTNNASIQDRRPEFAWSQSAPAAAWFYLQVSHNGTDYLHQWIEGATNWTPTVDLPGGTYTWAVQTWNSAGLGVWSQLATFTNQFAIPAIPVLVSPAGSVNVSPTQRYIWQADPSVTRDELYITRNGGVFFDQWYASTNSLVDIATGNFAVDVSGHGPGSYQWWVRGSSPDGLGTWSGGLNFPEEPSGREGGPDAGGPASQPHLPFALWAAPGASCSMRATAKRDSGMTPLAMEWCKGGCTECIDYRLTLRVRRGFCAKMAH